MKNNCPANAENADAGGTVIFSSRNRAHADTSPYFLFYREPPHGLCVPISTRALLAECDIRYIHACIVRCDFNPRTPCGVRRSSAIFSLVSASFQPTHPLRGATVSRRKIHVLPDISTHAPLAGCDNGSLGECRRAINFNPRTPYGVRQCIDKSHGCEILISTHALLAECDDKCTLGLRRVKKESFPPATPVEVHVKNVVSFGASIVSSEEKVFFYLVASDSVTENPAGSGRYDHDLSLVEPAKYAEMIVCDTQTVTNDIGRVYTANQVPVKSIINNDEEVYNWDGWNNY